MKIEIDALNERLAKTALASLGGQLPAGGTWSQQLHAQISADRIGSDGHGVISFSHFLPRIELMPEKRFLYLPTLSKAVGSNFLKRR